MNKPSINDPVTQKNHSLSVDQALAQIKAEIKPIEGFEQVALRDSLGRILAEDMRSPLNVPAYPNAAMDGYAIQGQDIPQTGVKTLQVIGHSLAGHPFKGLVSPGQCVRVMTGAMMPQGSDTVLMQEQVEVLGETIRFGAEQQIGQHVRQVGEDLAQGQLVLSQGQELLPSELGLLASLGFAEVAIKRRLRVAFFSTGDELRSLGEPLVEGQIYDSNRYTLYGMLTRLGVEVIDMGVVRDERQALYQAFSSAAESADVLITSGGVSVGEADFIKEILLELGQVHFWKIAIKPGRPLAFGQLKQAAFFGLPGNPVAVMVTFYQFVQPTLRYLMGYRDNETDNLWKVRCLSKLKKKPGRTEFQRGILEKESTGEWVVRSTGAQGSGILRSMSQGNCFIVLAAEQGPVQEGDWVEVKPFTGLV